MKVFLIVAAIYVAYLIIADAIYDWDFWSYLIGYFGCLIWRVGEEVAVKNP